MGNSLIFAVGALVHVKYVPKVLCLIQTLHLLTDRKEKKKDKLNRKSNRPRSSQKTDGGNHPLLKTRTLRLAGRHNEDISNMYTVGMFMPSVKLYQPKPNGKQLHIIPQADEICMKHVRSCFLPRSSAHQQQ